MGIRLDIDYHYIHINYTTNMIKWRYQHNILQNKFKRNLLYCLKYLRTIDLSN